MIKKDGEDCHKVPVKLLKRMKTSDVVQSLRKKSESVYGSDLCDSKSTKSRKGNLLVEIPF